MRQERKRLVLKKGGRSFCFGRTGRVYGSKAPYQPSHKRLIGFENGETRKESIAHGNSDMSKSIERGKQ